MKFLVLFAIFAFVATCYAAPGKEAAAGAEDLDTAAFGWGGGYGGYGGYGGGYGGYGGGYGGYGGGYGGYGGGYGGGYRRFGGWGR